MQFEVLGPLQVHGSDGPVPVNGRLQRTLLSLLLAAANRPVPAAILSEAIWPSSNGDGNAPRLHLLVHRLRQLLGDPDRLQLGPLGYQLLVGDDEFDAHRFEALADRVVAADPSDGAVGPELRNLVALARKALALWRGEPFRDLDSPELAVAAQTWSELKLAVQVRLFEAELLLGNHSAVAAELDDIARRHPLHERLQYLRMATLYRTGRPADALGVYRDTRRQLVDELGIEPGEALADLQQKILSGAPIGPTKPEVPSTIPAQLPPDTAGITGRGLETRTLTDLFTDRPAGPPRIVLLVGTAGVGKTALAVHCAHRLRSEFPDGQLFYDLRGFSTDPPVDPAEVLASFIRGLGGNTAGLSPDVSERTALYRSLIDGRRVLVVLDNARNAEQARPLLPGGAGSAVVVTSRASMSGLVAKDGADVVTLDRLSFDDSRALLVSLVGELRDDDAVRTLVGRCANLPLALRIAAEQLRAQPERDVAALVTEISGGGARLDRFDAGDGPDTDVRAVFSWSYASLPDPAAALFRRLGTLPGKDADLYAIAAMAGAGNSGADLRTTRNTLRILTGAHLVDESPPGRYHLHDLLRTYAEELARERDVPATLVAVRARLLSYLLGTAELAAQRVGTADGPPAGADGEGLVLPDLPDRPSAIEWFDSERSNITAAVTLTDAGEHGIAVAMSRILHRYLRTRGNAAEGLRVHHAAVDAARASNDFAGEADAELAVGTVHYSAGNGSAARPHFERSLALSRGVDHRRGIAVALNNLAGVAQAAGDAPQAIRLLDEALPILREVGDDVSVSLVLSNLGYAHWDLRQADLAIPRLQEAQRVAESCHNIHTQGWATECLAEVFEGLGRLDEALDQALRALELTTSSGHRVREAGAHAVLGKVHRRRGEQAKAVAELEQALEIALSAREAMLTGSVLEELGRSHGLDNPSAALPYLRQALDLVQTNSMRAREAQVRIALAEVHQQLDDSDAALAQLDLAAAGYTDLDDRLADETRTRADDLRRRITSRPAREGGR